MYTIYKTTNLVNQKIYLGLHRCPSNCRHLKNGSCKYYGSGTVLANAIKKYGKQNFSKEVLFVFETKEEALQKEVELITEEFVASDGNYNRTVGGNMPPNQLGYKHSSETKKIISESSVKRRDALADTARRTMKKRKQNDVFWSEDEIRKRVMTRKHQDSYSKTMAECNSKEAIAKRVATRKGQGTYSQDLSYLKDPTVVFERTKTRIQKQVAAGKKFSATTLLKYDITEPTVLP